MIVEQSSPRDGLEVLLEYTLLALLWLMYVGINPPAIVGGGSSDFVDALDSGGSSIVQLVYTGIFGFSVFLCWSVRKRRAFSYLPPLVILVPLMWCWLSIAWALAPSISARRLVSLTIIALTAVYLTSALGPARAMRVLYVGFASILIANWVAAIVLPGAIQAPDLESSVATWRGLQDHKNTAGPFCVLAALIFLDHARREGTWALDLFLAILAVIFLYKTMSKTSLALLAVVFVGGFFLRFLYYNPIIRRFFFYFCVSGLACAYLAWGEALTDYLAAIQDDPAAFTGRSQIWKLVGSYVADNFWLGSGYGSLWATGERSPLLSYGSGWVVNIAVAHNGYLELIAQTGIFGMMIGIVFLILLPIYKVSSQRLEAGQFRSLFASIILFCAMHNLLESSLLQQFNPLWVSFVIILTAMYRPLSVPPHGRPQHRQILPGGDAGASTTMSANSARKQD